MATPKRFLVYQITNLINNMIYVGAHVTRKIDDTYMGSGKESDRRDQKKRSPKRLRRLKGNEKKKKD